MEKLRKFDTQGEIIRVTLDVKMSLVQVVEDENMKIGWYSVTAATIFRGRAALCCRRLG